MPSRTFTSRLVEQKIWAIVYSSDIVGQSIKNPRVFVKIVVFIKKSYPGATYSCKVDIEVGFEPVFT